METTEDLTLIPSAPRDAFWDMLHELRQKGILCDIELSVRGSDGGMVVIPAHKLVLVASSLYFRQALERNDLLDVYNFDGILPSDLHAVLDYMYHQRAWEELEAESLVAANVLGIEQRPQPGEQRLYKDLMGKNVMVVPMTGTRKAKPKPIKSDTGRIFVDNVEEVFQQSMAYSRAGAKAEAQPQSAVTEPSTTYVSLQNILQQSPAQATADTPASQLALLADVSAETLSAVSAIQSSQSVVVSEPALVTPDGQMGDLASAGDGERQVVYVEVVEAVGSEDVTPVTSEMLKVDEDQPEQIVSQEEEPLLSEPVVVSKEDKNEDARLDTQSPKVVDQDENLVHSENVEEKPTTQEAKLITEGEKEGVNVEKTAEVTPRYSTRKRRFVLPDALQPGSSKKIKVEKEREPSNSGKQGSAPDKTDKSNVEENVGKEEDGGELLTHKKSLSQKEEPTVLGEEKSVKGEEPSVSGEEPPFKGEESLAQEDSAFHMCIPCNRQFSTAQGLAVHAGWAHNTGGVTQGAEPLECEICGLKARGGSALARHMRQAHNRQEVHRCSQEGCDQSFRTVRELRRHLSSVHDASSFFCDICNIAFKSPEGIKIHIVKFHSEVKNRLMCDLCGKTFKMKHELARHVRYTHSDAHNYKCNLCERAFKAPSTLKRHIQTFHSTVRNHHCDVCQASFKTGGDLNKHRSLHFRAVNPLGTDPKGNVKEPVRPCKYCGKQFTLLCNLQHHEQRVHEAKAEGVSYVCTICQKAFAVKAYLQQHIASKHRPKRFKCASCQAAFAQRYLLKRHIPRCKCIPKHLKPYHCQTCGATFLNRRNLQLHLEQPGRCLKEIDKQRQQQEDVDYVLYMNDNEEEDDAASEGGEGSGELYQVVEGQGELIQIGDRLIQVAGQPPEVIVQAENIIQDGEVEGEAQVALATEVGGAEQKLVLHVAEDGTLVAADGMEVVQDTS